MLPFRKKLIAAGIFLMAGVVFFVIASSGESSHVHYQLESFYQKLKEDPASLENRFMTIYGYVRENSIRKKGVEADFILEKDSFSIPIYFTGKTLLPDTFKDGSQAAAEGRFDPKKKIFIADKVMAKCASRYEAYPIDDTVR